MLNTLHKKYFITLVLVFIIPRTYTSEDAPSNEASALEQGYKVKSQFIIVDSSTSESDEYYYYLFHLYSRTNHYHENHTNVEDEFLMDMFHYNRDYPSTEIGPTMDHSLLDFGSSSSEMTISKTVLTPLKLKNDFYKLELEISRNDCLTLFLFLDSQEETKMTLNTEKHDAYFDFRKNPYNQFGMAISQYWGHAKESFDVVYNKTPITFEHVYLKIVCPFYSVYGDDQITFKVTKFHESYELDGKVTGEAANSKRISTWTRRVLRKR
jgi:hypothetical protein